MDRNPNFETRESLLKLCQYLEDNAEKLVQEGRVKIKPYSRRKRYDGINWTVIDIENLGRVHLMFTNGNSILKVNLIEVAVNGMILKFRKNEVLIHKLLTNKTKSCNSKNDWLLNANLRF